MRLALTALTFLTVLLVYTQKDKIYPPTMSYTLPITGKFLVGGSILLAFIIIVALLFFKQK